MLPVVLCQFFEYAAVLETLLEDGHGHHLNYRYLNLIDVKWWFVESKVVESYLTGVNKAVVVVVVEKV